MSPTPDWAGKHWQTIRAAYARAPFFEAYAPMLEALYQRPRAGDAAERHQSRVHRWRSCRARHHDADHVVDRTTARPSGRNERLVDDLRQQAGATDYLSGPSARDYMDEAMFAAAGVARPLRRLLRLSRVPAAVSAFRASTSASLDLLFCTGPRRAHVPEATCLMRPRCAPTALSIVTSLYRSAPYPGGVLRRAARRPPPR